MRVVVQRVSTAEVRVDGNVIGSCQQGYLLLVGFTNGDNPDVCALMAQKVVNLRILEDENMKMNLSLEQVKGEILSISQFTLYADTTTGRRPSFINALEPKEASRLYDVFNKCLFELGIKVATGMFGADMKVSLTNDGPVTIIIDSNEFQQGKLGKR